MTNNPGRIVRKAVKFTCLLFLSALIAGCGFQLRTYDLSSDVDTFVVTGKQRIAVAQPLRRTLQQAGLSEQNQNADLTVELLDQRRERRSVSTAGQARAAEYETTYAVQFRLLGGEQQELLPATWIERERVYRIDRDNIVGSSEEQAILERELMQDVVAQILRSINAVSQQSASTAGD